MPRQLGRLFLWFCIGYFLIIRLREITQDGPITDQLAEFQDPHLLGLKISAALAFFSYTLCQYLLLYYGFNRLKWYFLAAAQLVLVLGCMFFRAFLDEVVVQAITGTGNYNPNMTWENYLWDNVYYAVIFCSLGIVFYFYQLAAFNEVWRRESEVIQRETELKFLRSQVNPHFLFNTLNNLYALVNVNSGKSLPALEKLSGLLRYALYEKEAKVSLDKEIDYLKDFIHLESLRIHNLAEPKLTVGPFTRNWEIPPLLLVPFVENAFKHGELTRPEAPLTITISEEAGRLRMHFFNLIRQQRTSIDGVGGIGLVNVRKRLELLYPNRHTINIQASEDTFAVTVTLTGEQVVQQSSKPLPSAGFNVSYPSPTVQG